MTAALVLLYKLLPLYITVGLGWMAGRYLQASGSHIAGIMLYIVTPSVIFAGVMAAPLSPSVILLPFLVFGFCSALALVHLAIAKWWLKDPVANLIPLSVGTGNTGYFGIPVALLLFGEQGLSIYIVCMLGTTLFENSVGFYLAARGRFGVRDCLLKVARLPAIYAFALAVTLNLSQIGMPEVLIPLFDNLRGAYSILGMMIVGMGILSMRGLAGDLRFTGLAFLASSSLGLYWRWLSGGSIVGFCRYTIWPYTKRFFLYPSRPSRLIPWSLPHCWIRLQDKWRALRCSVPLLPCCTSL